MVQQVADYLTLVPSKNRNKPKFIAELSALLQPLVDCQTVLTTMPGLYDLDVAVGVQLDAVGLWAGVGRTVKVAIGGIYFSWDTPLLGWDQGRWKGPFDDTTTSYSLADGVYRTLIRARIASNSWDGTMAGAQAAYAFIFTNPSTRVFVQDNLDLTFSLNVAGQPLDVISLALLTGGYLPIRAVTIQLRGVNQVTVTGTPLFGFDDASSLVEGWDIGSWGSNVATSPT